MFLPVKPNFPLYRWPVMTALTCLICCIVFLKQDSDWHAFNVASERYCESRSRLVHMVIKQLVESNDLKYCSDVMFIIANYGDETELLNEFLEEMRPLRGYSDKDSKEYVRQLLTDELRRYRQIVPPDPDGDLAYISSSWNPWHMITSSFAHGGWRHLIFNLIFFIAFGITIEMLITPLAYAGLFVFISVFTGIFTSVATMASGIPTSSLGLSGVVMGAIGLSAYLLPRGKIRCFYFFVVYFGTVAVPIWALALWYIGGDIYALFANDDHGVINVMSHVTGGVGGYLFGVMFLQRFREEGLGLQMELDQLQFKPTFK